MTNRRQVLIGLGLASIGLPLRIAGAAEPTRLFFYELYKKGTTELSEKALGLAGVTVEIVGFMAPPLKAESPFFVLTDIPMETCPFCDQIAFWPDNIIYVTSDDPLPAVPFDRQIRVSGVLDLGPATDEATGFVSLVRLKRASVTRS
ncbi:MAG: hypothetical protein AB7P12_12845 [Alphaproteobacteria bacterium]